MLKENGYQKSIISKIFKRITNNHSLSQSQQLMQATDIQEEEIRISISLPYVEGTSEKLRCILRSRNIRSTFYRENTLLKSHCIPKDRVATENKNNIVYQIDCSDCEAVHLDESKRFLKSLSDDLSGIAIVIRMKLQNIVGKQITTLTEIRRKLFIGKAG